MIYLRVGTLEVDWGKNNGFVDHNALFQSGDLAVVPYYYIDRRSEAEPDEPGEVVETEEGYRWKLITEQREGYSKPLREVIDRIEMLGYTEAYSRREFAYFAALNGFDKTLFTYDELAAVLRAVDVTAYRLIMARAARISASSFDARSSAACPLKVLPRIRITSGATRRRPWRI